ncbi:hypothetical protein PILCRDRAFT_3670 [Piloderma croceum F 1598]|uniref:DUF6533 domain-containing protein n=1 Tax=Piloderma croceum (strain F 1598) TaxID=765440 RepID=A0A0C3GBF5_PILCF|nr:hypothetical protein PILCRDRAFT_3670 [Piloderma croceum F 1598]
MSAPSTTSYLPLDSDAPSLMNDYMFGIAFVMLVLYDHVITLDKEVEWIWTLRWGLPKITFLVNRYVLTWLIVTSLELNPTIFTDGHRKLVILSLGGLLVVVFACTTMVQMLWPHTFLLYEFKPGCWPSSNSNDVQWIPALSLEGACSTPYAGSLWLKAAVILILLTAHKVVSTYRNHMNRTITVLARDSTIYFVIIFVGLTLTLADGFVHFTSFPTLLLTQCITSVAVGRMMMNIRGLILDDPEHTVHLQTLEFLSRPNPGSETEEEA